VLADPGGVLVTDGDTGVDPEPLVVVVVDAEVGGAVEAEPLVVVDADAEVGGAVDEELLIVVGGVLNVIAKGANSRTMTLLSRHCAAMNRYSPG
jgi:hypothetical protein